MSPYFSSVVGQVLDPYLRALATDSAGELNVLGHNGHTFRVDCAQVGVLEEANELHKRGEGGSNSGRHIEGKGSNLVRCGVGACYSRKPRKPLARRQRPTTGSEDQS